MVKQITIKLQSWCQKDNEFINRKSKVTFLARMDTTVQRKKIKDLTMSKKVEIININYFHIIII